ncbi:hypothetical protein D9756_005770 [Leucocoprinus leucothites]|uniref:BTB domain-containing protein n=1 Tax=Leucocoprinus leucothites TaxID=201217 RepID=A0A8H5DA54_9AGAR|nr:hypothetical protein D9756_005770 [Leucoagaricus leucothites]
MGKNPNQTNQHQHQDYYIKGGDLYLRADKTHFRIHSYFFVRESKYWRDELVGPTSPGDETLKKGQDEKNAFAIDETPTDFAQFLWVFYNNNFGNYSTASREQWEIILRLAAKWGFNEVKELAVRHLEGIVDIDPVSRVALYQEHGVAEKYLFPLYVKLAERKEFIGLDEARALGMETFVLVQQARERLRAQVSKESPFLSPIRTDLKRKDISDIIVLTFNLKLKDQPVGPITSNKDQVDEPLKKGRGPLDPYIITGIKPAEFTQFLWVFYNRKYGDYSKGTRAGWTAILRLAAQWGFLEIKDLAVEHLELHEMDHIRRLRLYLDSQVAEKYLFPLYVHLTSRKEVLELEEARILGIETFVLIQQARERLRAQASPTDPSHSPVRPDVQQGDVNNVVSSVFKISPCPM